MIVLDLVTDLMLFDLSLGGTGCYGGGSAGSGRFRPPNYGVRIGGVRESETQAGSFSGCIPHRLSKRDGHHAILKSHILDVVARDNERIFYAGVVDENEIFSVYYQLSVGHAELNRIHLRRRVCEC